VTFSNEFINVFQGLWRFVAVCGGLWRFVAVCGGFSTSLFVLLLSWFAVFSFSGVRFFVFV